MAREDTECLKRFLSASEDHLVYLFRTGQWLDLHYNVANIYCLAIKVQLRPMRRAFQGIGKSLHYIVVQSKAFSSNFLMHQQGVQVRKLPSMCLHGDLAGTGVATSSWDQCRLHLSVKSRELRAWLIAASLSKSSCYHGEPDFSGWLWFRLQGLRTSLYLNADSFLPSGKGNVSEGLSQGLSCKHQVCMF